MHDSPGSVVTQLCSGLQLYSAERRIADCILADVKWASVATSAELAKASHSSEATVTQLCHKLGYANYRKFQLELARDVLEQQETEARKRPPNDPLHQALLDLQNNRQEEVQATIQALNLVQLRKVLSILRAAEIIEIEANGSSLPVAMAASLKLGSLGKRCMISPVPEKARSFASALTAKKNGTPVILITCDKRSALAGHASYTLLASNRIQRIASDMMPSQLSAALVVEAIYYLLVGNCELNYAQKSPGRSARDFLLCLSDHALKTYLSMRWNASSMRQRGEARFMRRWQGPKNMGPAWMAAPTSQQACSTSSMVLPWALHQSVQSTHSM